MDSSTNGKFRNARPLSYIAGRWWITTVLFSFLFNLCSVIAFLAGEYSGQLRLKKTRLLLNYIFYSQSFVSVLFFSRRKTRTYNLLLKIFAIGFTNVDPLFYISVDGCEYGPGFIDECNNDCDCVDGRFYGCTRKACKPGERPEVPMKCASSDNLPLRTGQHVLCDEGIVKLQEKGVCRKLGFF